MGNRGKVIFICTGNSCRSQMAEGLLRNMAGDLFEVFSAGSHPSRLHPASIIVMAELGIDISNHSADNIDEYLDKNIDIVISVCDNAVRPVLHSLEIFNRSIGVLMTLLEDGIIMKIRWNHSELQEKK